MSTTSYTHKFVDSLPELSSMSDGVLYVCMEYAVASHRCMCGCGAEVVTPFSPARWSISFDGRFVSLHPSVGNWGSQCESHYWLKSGDVHWSRQFSQDEIAFVRRIDQADLDATVLFSQADDAADFPARRVHTGLIRSFGEWLRQCFADK